MQRRSHGASLALLGNDLGTPNQSQAEGGRKSEYCGSGGVIAEREICRWGRQLGLLKNVVALVGVDGAVQLCKTGFSTNDGSSPSFRAGVRMYSVSTAKSVNKI